LIAAESAASAAVPREEAGSRWILGPARDRLFFVYSPLLALALGVAASLTPLADETFSLYGRSESWVSLFSGAFTMAHLSIVFFRSHGNPAIFSLYPKRFLLAPPLLLGAMLVSKWALVTAFVLAVWWDVYHSALQTFGLGRLYDAKAGADSEEARRLDRGLNLVLYIGPILAGATLMDHAAHFDKFGNLGAVFLSGIPAALDARRGPLSLAALGAGAAYVAYYLWRVRALVRAGLPVPREKTVLFASTAACSIYTWGFNSFGQAFFIMNFFHALQYFALVWHAEKTRIRFLPFLLGAGFAYGVWAKLWGESSHAAFAVLLTVSLLHFWYDGFVWSVRKKQIA